MSSLRLKRRSVYIKYKTPTGIWKEMFTGIKIDKVVKRNGSVIFPQSARDIQKHIDEEIAKQRFGFLSPPIATLSPTVLEVCEELLRLKEGRLSPATEYEYRYCCKLLAKIPVSDLTDFNIATWRAGLLESLNENTVAKHLRHLSTIIAYAVKKGYCDTNVVEDMKIKPVSSPPILFTGDELRAFFTAAPADMYHQCLFLLLTGMRVQESCDLRWSMVNWGNSTILYRNQKGRRPELIQMDSWIFDVLSSIPQEHSPYVFKYRSRFAIAHDFARIRDNTGLRAELTLHAFKRTFVTSLYETGMDLLSLKSLAHHASIQTSEQHYINFRKSHLAEKLEQSRKGFEHLRSMAIPNKRAVSNNEKDICRVTNGSQNQDKLENVMRPYKMTK